MTPSPTEMHLFAVACGFLIAGSFMRYVWKTPASARNATPKDRSSTGGRAD